MAQITTVVEVTANSVVVMVATVMDAEATVKIEGAMVRAVEDTIEVAMAVATSSVEATVETEVAIEEALASSLRTLASLEIWALTQTNAKWR